MCPKMENCKKMMFSKKKHSEFFILGNICPRNEMASNKTENIKDQNDLSIERKKRALLYDRKKIHFFYTP